MVVKQTNTAEIDAYGGRGIEYFDEIERQLNALIEETASVLYNGMRAKDFKTTCCQNAVDFGTISVQNMQSMADVISAASSYVATNLGGQAVNLEPPTRTFSLPAIQADETIETADDAVLNGLSATCNDIYTAIATAYTDHLSDFESLGANEFWVGPEYDDALADVQNLTGVAMDAVTESKDLMMKAIADQLADLGM